MKREIRDGEFTFQFSRGYPHDIEARLIEKAGEIGRNSTQDGAEMI